MQHETECRVDPLRASVDPAQLAGTREVTLAVAGMGCPNCANRVRNALLRCRHVLEVEVDLRGSLARVWCDPDASVPPEALTRAVAEASRGTHHRYLAVPLRSRPEGGNGRGSAHVASRGG